MQPFAFPRQTFFSKPHVLASRMSHASTFAYALAICVISALPLQAQNAPSPSQLLPQNLRPIPTSPLGTPLINGPLEIQAPKGSATHFISLDHISVENGFTEFAAQTQALIAPLLGDRHSIADFYALANQIEEIYARAGYVLVRVNVPQQKLRDHGTLHLSITDGFIESIDDSAVPISARALVGERLAALRGTHHITLAAIERALLLAGQLPGLTLKSTLMRGEYNGGTRLIVEASTKTFGFNISADNHLPASTGTWEHISTLQINNVMHYGEQVYTNFVSSTELKRVFDSTSPLRTFAIGSIIPLGVDGWSLNPEYTYSRTRPTPAAGTAQTVSHYQRLAARLSYAAILTRTQSLTYNFSLEDIAQSTDYEATLIDVNRDHYRAARFSSTFETTLPHFEQSLQFTASLSQGLGGRKGDDIPLSRQGAHDDFSKLAFDARLNTPLNGNTNFVLMPHSQVSFSKALLTPEQMSLDGAQSISGFASGALSVDEGAVVRAELQHTITTNALPAPLIPYLFAAAGYGRLNDPTIVEVAQLRAYAFGLGLRSQYALSKDSQFTLMAEGARDISNAINLAHAWRTSVSLGLSF